MQGALIIRVNVKEEAGYWYANSPDLLGLHICGRSAEQACSSALKAVKALFKHNRGLDVDVMPATEEQDSFPRLKGPVDRFVVQPMHA